MNNDISNLLINLIQKKQKDFQFFIKFELDNNNRFTCLFWMTPKQIVL
jgi:hypothetical protein